MNGNSILILKNNETVASYRSRAHEKSAELQTQVGTIEIASATENEWKSFIAGRKEWSLNVSYLVSAVGELTNVLEVGSTVTLMITNSSKSTKLQGTAIVTQCKQSYARGALCNGSFSFKGTGALQQV